MSIFKIDYVQPLEKQKSKYKTKPEAIPKVTKKVARKTNEVKYAYESWVPQVLPFAKFSWSEFGVTQYFPAVHAIIISCQASPVEHLQKKVLKFEV